MATPEASSTSSPRPRQITTAVRLLFAFSVLSIVQIPVNLVMLAAQAKTSTESPVRALTDVTIVTGVALTCLLTILGLFLGRGRNGARRTAMVVASLMAIGSLENAIILVLPGLGAHMVERMPGWYLPVILARSAGIIAMAVPVVVLLRQSAAKAYCAKPAAVPTELPEDSPTRSSFGGVPD